MYAAQDYITCEVLDVSADAERISLGMIYDDKLHKTPPFGLVSVHNLPEYYKYVTFYNIIFSEN